MRPARNGRHCSERFFKHVGREGKSSRFESCCARVTPPPLELIMCNDDSFGDLLGEIAGIEAQLDAAGTVCGPLTIMYDAADDGFIRDASEWDILAVACRTDPRIYHRSVDIGDGFFHHEYYYNPLGWTVHPAVR